MENVTPKSCCFKIEPPTLILFYELNESGKIHRRSIPIRNLNEKSRIDDIIKDLNNTHHQKYLKTVPEKQLKRLLKKLHEKIYSYGKATNLVSPSNSDEDFNKLDDEELNKVKDKMSESFEQNRVKPGDPEWKYEIDVDFEAGNGNKLESGWDSEESELEF
ncbi:centrosomal protein of 19 kDa-like [Rhopilema esculentum]|uniref:centrosomal protein of 19 kDa-like n=1 Tax=Rhopilema esculentum TaxID=499914 RepID=UPI0031E263E2